MLLPDDREQWQTRSQFTFALVNLAVGASNVCTFPYLVYENGGQSASSGASPGGYISRHLPVSSTLYFRALTVPGSCPDLLKSPRGAGSAAYPPTTVFADFLHVYVGTGDVNCYRTRMSHHWQSERRDTFFSVVVFVAVYALLAAAVGLPMLYLEAFLGQFSGWSVPQSFGGFPMAKGYRSPSLITPAYISNIYRIGWTMAYVALLLSMYHAPIVAYSLIYLAECFLYQLPWDSCPGSRTAVNGTATNTSSSPSSPSGFISTDDGCYEIRQGLYPCVRLNATMARRYSSANYTGLRAVAVQTDDGKAVAVPLTEYEALHKNCINGTLSAQEYHFRRQVVHLSSSIDEMGTFQVGVAVAMVFCGFFVFVAIFKGPQSLGKLSVVIVYLSTLLLCVLCAAAMAQDGAPLGLWACFKPDPWKLIDIKTWHSASRHMFYSLSLSCGTVTCLASYNDFQANVFEPKGPESHVMKASLADFGYSMLATVFVFGLYGSLAQSSQMEVGDVVTHGIDFAFVGFPEAISPRSNQRLWCFAFYLTLFILNLGSQVCVVEGYMRSLKDTCLWLRQRSSLAAVLGGAGCTILAMPLALQAGLYMLELMESLIYGDLLPWVGLAELIAVAHGYVGHR
ncbi:sodium- and chloride-dependent neutral and basic amino acid transporter B(0+)-like [Amblyomma americanum]